MYVWVILATFLAMLASYTLSVRPDIREVTVEPLAEAQLGRLITKHNAALMYVADHTPEPEAASKQVTYVPSKRISESNLNGYFDIQVNDVRYESWIFCTSKTNKSTLYNTSAGCDLEDANRFLVTMGPIPRRWVNLVDGRPNSDYLNAMGRMAGAKMGLGYADDSAGVINSPENVTKSAWIVKNHTSSKIFIPKAITTFGAFNDICVDNICVIYISGI